MVWHQFKTMHYVRKTVWKLSTEPEIRHYKVSFKLNTDLKHVVRRLRKESDALTPSYGVIRTGHKNVYVVYFSGWVNYCGSSNREDIILGVKHFRKLANLPREIPHRHQRFCINIDNITARGVLGIDVRLTEIIDTHTELRHCQQSDCEVAGCSDPKICFRPMHFPGLHIRFAKKNRQGEMEKLGGGGLVTLFQTGKYSIVGVKNEMRLNYVYWKTRDLLSQIHCRLGRTMAC